MAVPSKHQTVFNIQTAHGLYPKQTRQTHFHQACPEKHNQYHNTPTRLC